MTCSLFLVAGKMDYMDFDELDEDYDFSSTIKYKVTVNADDDSYVSEPELETKRTNRNGGRRPTGRGMLTTTRKPTNKDSTSSSKIGDIVYVFGEKMLSNRPRLSKSANDLFSEAYGLLQKMSIKTRRGRRANLAAFFILYIASKKLKLGVDPVLLAMDVGLTCKDTVTAIEEFIPELSTTNPLEIEILELIYQAEITDIFEDYMERMWLTFRKNIVLDAASSDVWKQITSAMTGYSYESWCREIKEQLLCLIDRKTTEGEMDNRIHIISPQKLYVLVIYNVLRNVLHRDSEDPITSNQEKHLQKILTVIWGQIANNLEKTRRKTVGL
jgi:hypothetical protein